MKLSIIYVNYNTDELLFDSLKSLHELAIKRTDYEVIVVDNASRDFASDKLSKLYPRVQILQQPTNLGFGGGNNIGVQAAKGEYVWLLNTDTLIPKDNKIDELISFLDGHPEYAAALPLLTDNEMRIQPAQVDDLPTVFDLTVRKPLDTLRRKAADDDMPPESSGTVEVAVAAALIVRRTDYQLVGGFDSRYFMYYEDTDLCKALKVAGKKIYFARESHIIHLWGGSIKSSADRKQYYYRSQLKYFRKWHGLAATSWLALVRFPKVVKNVYLARMHERNS